MTDTRIMRINFSIDVFVNGEAPADLTERVQRRLRSYDLRCALREAGYSAVAEDGIAVEIDVTSELFGTPHGQRFSSEREGPGARPKRAKAARGSV